MKRKIKEQKKTVVAGIGIVLAVVLLMAVFVGMNSGQRELNKLLDLGQKYLDDMAYEDAVVVFDEAIAIDPKCGQAYMGKAQAQYALGYYEDAAATLQEGIGRVDDSAELEAFLQQILSEMPDTTETVIPDTVMETEDTVGLEEKLGRPFLLNYEEIVRRTDTEEPDIQLEVLGGNSGKKYIWESDNIACATVSETGLVTCLPVAGYATITATDENGKYEKCFITIVDSEEELEYDHMRIGSSEQDVYFTTSLLKKEETKEMELIAGNYFVGNYVYYSGDISIPEHLTYEGKNIPVTGISDETFFWCNTMESISIPASVRLVTDFYQNPFYYCFELEKIEVDERNDFLESVDGVLYSKDGKELISYPASRSGDTYTIPREVEIIYPGAFVACKNLQKILVEEGNQYYESIDGVLMDKENRLVAYPVGNRAVKYTAPAQIVEIMENAFYMSELEEVVCEGVESIGTWSFCQSSKLKKIGGGNATKGLRVSGRQLNGDGVVEIINIDEMNYLEDLELDYFDDSSSGAAKTMDLHEIGKLESLESLTIVGIDDLSKWSWIDNLQMLDEVTISGCELSNDDLFLFQKLPDLEKISVGRVQTLSDISWVEGLHNLERFALRADRIETEDFSLLFELPNLKYVEISNYSESEGLKEQFETIKAENPNITIWYSE